MHRPGCHLERTRAIPPRSHLGTIGLLSFRAAAQPVKASPNTTSFVRSGSHRRPRCIEDDAHDCLPCQHATRSTTQTREMIASCEAPRLPIGTKERSLDASALHPTCQTNHTAEPVFFLATSMHRATYDQDSARQMTPLNHPHAMGKRSTHPWDGLKKRWGKPMAHHPDPSW
ncbi:hypothetical protein RIF29_02135 [Crotalaria pallida]|uniref:Uncharacterized protein n=1 Tax=Crotalaria pallida TaxID=3830 RepID=A0AAN9P8F2_CROPI